MGRKRKGMVIKNTNDKPVEIVLASRKIVLYPGDERPITSEEVKDPLLRESLQVRAISIVRPTTDDEEAAVRRLLEERNVED